MDRQARPHHQERDVPPGRAPLCAQAGIGHVYPHMLRHTFAHLYRLNGGNDDDLMRVAGWRSREMLSRYGASVAEVRAAEMHDRVSPRRGL